MVSSMTRLRFLGLTLGSLALVGAALLQGACSDGAGEASPSGDGQPPSSSSSGATAAQVQALGKWCMDDPQRQIGDHAIGGAEIEAARAAYAAGATDIPLSPSKCTRLFVTREGDRIASETLVRAPFEVSVDPKTYELVYTPAAITRWTYVPDGETFAADYDGDGFDEARMRVTYEKEAVREERAPGSDAILARTTATIAPGGGVVDVVAEELVDGALAVTRRVRAPLLQKACNPVQKKPPPPTPPKGVFEGPTRACTDAERDAISKLISTALQKGSGCLYAAGMRAQSDQLLRTYIRNEARFDCTDDAKLELWAANETGYMNFFPGKIRLIFFSQLFSQPQSFQEGTVGHELFHFFDVHDPDLEAAASTEQLEMSDPVYACEALCFGDKPNTCHLAACQQRKLSSSWKGKRCDGTVDRDDAYEIEKARGDGVSIASCTSGQQVGALCRSKTNGTEVQFCTTEAECAAACGGSCESKSLSCLPDCR